MTTRRTVMPKRIGTAIRIALLAACATLLPRGAVAQETINYASVSGRVTDPSGGVVAGAQVTARQTDTNLTAEAATDGEGRFRFPYLRVGPYEITVRQAGFADATRQLTLTVGSAFELPVSLTARPRWRTSSRSPRQPSCSRRRAARSPARSRRRRSGTCPSTGATSSTWRSWCPACRRPTSAARSSLPRRRRLPGRASRSAASATSPTTSSSTVCPPTTMPPG